MFLDSYGNKITFLSQEEIDKLINKVINMNNLEKLILEKRGVITIGDKILIDLVLSEVQSEVEKKKVDIAGKRIWIKEVGLSKNAVKRGTWKSKNYNKAIADISTIIENLKVK